MYVLYSTKYINVHDISSELRVQGPRSPPFRLRKRGNEYLFIRNWTVSYVTVQYKVHEGLQHLFQGYIPVKLNAICIPHTKRGTQVFLVGIDSLPKCYSGKHFLSPRSQIALLFGPTTTGEALVQTLERLLWSAF